MDRPEALVKKPLRRQVSFMWLIPLVTALFGFGLLLEYQWSKGPSITLVFDQEEDIVSNKTEIRAMNVKVGMITAVQLSDDFKHIIATAELHRTAEHMIRKDTVFWVVKPRVTKEGISGLNTLFSGTYINLQPGVKDKKTRTFHVLPKPPVADPDEKGLRILLCHDDLGALDTGDPVFFKGFVVGRIEDVQLELEQKHVTYHLFIYAPYDELIYENTRFWMKKSLEFNVSEKGVQLKIGSLENLLQGGVAFGAEDADHPGNRITRQNSRFYLHRSRQDIHNERYANGKQYILLFNESVRGLSSMAAIEYRGIRIGTVLKAPFETEAPVAFPERPVPVLASIDLQATRKAYGQSDQDLFKKGFSAALRTNQIVTGKQEIEVGFKPLSTPFKPETYAGYPVFPTHRSTLNLLKEELIHLSSSLRQLSEGKGQGELRQTLTSLRQFMNKGKGVLGQLEKMMQNEDFKHLPTSLHHSLASLEATLSHFTEGSEEFHGLQQGLVHLDDVLIQLQPLLEQLNRKPNALIFNGSAPSDPTLKVRRP